MDINITSVTHIVESLEEGLYFTDRNRIITYWNSSAERITGYSAKEVVGSKCSDNILVHIDKVGNSLCCSMCPLAATMNDGKPRCQEVYLHNKKGHRIPVSVRVNTLVDSSNNIVGAVEIFTDLSSEEANIRRIRKLEKLALIDKLTQLVNRNYLDSELESSIKRFRTYGIKFGILFIDIDHFKVINDTYGHSTGDEILKLVAKNLISTSRPFDIFGRWGGEEFLGIIPNVDDENILNIAERIRVKIENSYLTINNKKISVTVSIGIASTENNDTVDKILKRADELLYKSKEGGRNRVSIE